MVTTIPNSALPIPPKHLQEKALAEFLAPEKLQMVMDYPEMATDLYLILQAPDFSSDYVPTILEVLFDDVTVLVWKNGQVTGQFPDMAADYQPETVEFMLDGETAHLSIRGMEIVNRIQSLPLLNQTALGALDQLETGLSQFGQAEV
ncbi:MAG: hypothetical protein F6K19_45620 [Cyanothece sp. SIO1E1]|nr:hypothetical protein [Cyanothece sp. SIO1E1]